jgi:hypothetical protein
MAEDIKKPEDTKNYLAGLSNKDLDQMYASVARTTGNDEPNAQMKEIEAEMEKRYNSFHSAKETKETK